MRDRETRDRLLEGRGAAVRRARLQEGHRARHLPRRAAPTSPPSTTTSATRSASTGRCCSSRSRRCARPRRRARGRARAARRASGCGATSRCLMCRAMRSGNAAWISRLIHREMTDPTPAFDALVEQAFRPRVDDMAAIVAEILDCAPDDRARLAVRREHPRAVDAVRAESDGVALPLQAPAPRRRRGEAGRAHRASSRSPASTRCYAANEVEGYR